MTNKIMQPMRATADVWYDFGFQTVGIISRKTGKFLKWVTVPDQSDRHAAMMRHLWGLHTRMRGAFVLVRA